MKNEELSEMTMVMALSDYLAQNTSITNLVAPFSQYATTLRNALLQWQTLAEIQVADTKGIAQTKTMLRNSLAMASFEVGRKVCSYALSINNLKLFNECNISDTKLKRANDNMLKEYSQLIYDRANANLAALAPFGITAAIMTNLQNAINNYVASIPKPRIGISERKQATLQIKALHLTIKDVLKKLDLLVDGMKYSQANFYNGYITCRKKINSSSRSIALKAKITDAETGEPIKAAKVLIEHTDGKTVFRKKASLQGGFIVKHMPEGKYKVTVSEVGYEDIVMECFVNTVEMYNLKVEMKRI